MRASAGKRAIGREDGEFLVARCPCGSDVSTPQSFWEDDPHTNSFAYTRGQRLTPTDIRRRTLNGPIAFALRATRRARLGNRDLTILQERDAGRTYAAIGRKHGITHERVRQLLVRAYKVIEYLDAVQPASDDDETTLHDGGSRVRRRTGSR
jgi:DNA-directed RNA polymerase sigma subunit (sigma70/sigma32)